MKKYVGLSRDAEGLFPRAQAVVREAGRVRESDPQGSYTGVPARKGETPSQDADDL